MQSKGVDFSGVFRKGRRKNSKRFQRNVVVDKCQPVLSAKGQMRYAIVTYLSIKMIAWRLNNSITQAIFPQKHNFRNTCKNIST